jgi:hypothetical protein
MYFTPKVTSYESAIKWPHRLENGNLNSETIR